MCCDCLRKLAGKSLIWLQANPGMMVFVAQGFGRSANSGTHLENIGPEIGCDLLIQVVFPPRRSSEQLELRSNVCIITHGFCHSA